MKITIKNKNSGKEISNSGGENGFFPHYEKYNGRYGFLSVTIEGEVLFFYHENDDVKYTDVTDDFEILTN